MTRSHLPPSQAGEISRTKRRTAEVERRLKNRDTVSGYVAKWYHEGILTATTSGVEEHPAGGVLEALRGRLVVPSTDGPVEIALLHLGVVVDTVSFPEGVDRFHTTLTLEVRQDEPLRIQIVSPGVEAEKMTIWGDFDR